MEKIPDPFYPFQTSFDNALAECLKLSKSLMPERNYLFVNHEDDSSQYWRRTFIRASWSLVDGEAYALKEICRSVDHYVLSQLHLQTNNF